MGQSQEDCTFSDSEGLVPKEIGLRSRDGVSAGEMATPPRDDEPAMSAYAREEQRAQELARQHGVEFVRLSTTEPAPNVTGLLPQWIVNEHHVLAVKFEGDVLHVAMENPLDLPALDQLNLVTGITIQPIVGTRRDIDQAIGRLYGAEQITKQDLIDARFDEHAAQEVDQKVEQLVISEDTGQIVRLVNSIFKDAIDQQASDIHFEPAGDELRVRFRVDGILHDCLMIPTALRKEVVSRLKVLAHMDITEKRRAQDGHISLNYEDTPYDLRVSVVPITDGEKTVIRILDKNRLATDLLSLGLETNDMQWVQRTIQRPHGMILVTGPTGSGKTTTLYAVLQSLNAVEKNIITVENPAEYELDRINQIQINPDAGETFAGALRSILRQDPDIIMIGEIRDCETAKIAIQAALTGHLVLSTLHTNDAVTAITRLRDLGIEPFLISSCVVMTIAQRLVRKICPDCKTEYTPDEETRASLGIGTQPRRQYMRGQGCPFCLQAGYQGREAVFEVLRVDHDVQQAILAHKGASEIREIAVTNGMHTLLDSALNKAFNHATTLEEVRRVIAPETF